ncbi:MAG: hypothetical protein JSS11_16135, partial [Verrucomicrobia bacterium]|nr:hypothetical protein [Verrucomicrobiota bacterium]
MNKFVSQFLLRPAAVAAGLAVLALLAQPARAQVVVSNFVITSDSISFDLSGTLIGSASGDATQLRLVPEQAVSTVAFNDFFAAHSSTLNVGGALLTRIDAQAGNSS